MFYCAKYYFQQNYPQQNYFQQNKLNMCNLCVICVTFDFDNEKCYEVIESKTSQIT